MNMKHVRAIKFDYVKILAMLKYMFIVINSSYFPELMNCFVGTLFGTVMHYINESKNVIHDLGLQGWSLALIHGPWPLYKYHKVRIIVVYSS